MIHQAFKAGQKVQLKKKHVDCDITYTVITVEPLFSKITIAQKLSNIFGTKKMEKEIINYKYRCKSKIDMKDFFQEELLGT